MGFFLLCGFSCLHALGCSLPVFSLQQVSREQSRKSSSPHHKCFPLVLRAISTADSGQVAIVPVPLSECCYHVPAIRSHLLPPPSPLPKLDTLPLVIAVPPSSRVSLCVPQKLGLNFPFFFYRRKSYAMGMHASIAYPSSRARFFLLSRVRICELLFQLSNSA